MNDRQLQASIATQATRAVSLSGYPDECPRCHTKVVPRYLGTFTGMLSPDSHVEEAFQCTNAKCGGLFIGIYRPSNIGVNPPRYQFLGSTPLEPRKPEVPQSVSELSPVFFETYSQALVGESLGLTQLTGIGLRKALEFLVKDFASKENPSAQAEIAQKALGRCINDYIADPNVKGMAKRAAWLGNDETHYLRKWDNKDISDLKILLKLTINGIENVLLTKKFIAEMPEGKSEGAR